MAVDVPGGGHGRQSSASNLNLASPGVGLTGMGTTRSVRVRPSASAFRSNTIATTTPSSQQQNSDAQPDEWGVAAEARRFEQQAQPQQEGVLSRVSSMVFTRLLG